MEHVFGITTFFSDRFNFKSDLQPLTKEGITKNVGEALALHQAGKGAEALAILNDLVTTYNDPLAKQELKHIQDAIDVELDRASGYQKTSGSGSMAFYIFSELSRRYDHPKAQKELGVMCTKGYDDVPPDLAQAFSYTKRSAGQGCAPAQYNLAVAYSQGLGVKRDDAQAFAWHKKAADQGHAPSQCRLAIMHARGEGCVSDNKEAVRLLQLAVDQGDGLAHFYLGFHYANGLGVTQDEGKANALYVIAWKSPEGRKCLEALGPKRDSIDIERQKNDQEELEELLNTRGADSESSEAESHLTAFRSRQGSINIDEGQQLDQEELDKQWESAYTWPDSDPD